MRRLALFLAALLAVAGVVGWLVRGSGGAAAPLPIPGEGERITVEVLNGTRVDGLARETTRRLRRHGIDVVYFGTSGVDTLSATRLLVRRGDSTAAVRVRDALGVGEIAVAPDRRLLLDVTVLLGADAAAARRRSP